MFTVLLAAASFASSGGISGQSVAGCTCHGATADSSTTVTFEGAPSIAVLPSARVDLFVRIASTNTARTAAGLDVSATGGAFTAGAGTRLAGVELTHTSPRPFSSGSVAVPVAWTAPAAEGQYTLRVAGNAVNQANGNSGDGWSVTTLVLTVDDGCHDVDGDLVTDCAGDCADQDADIHPGALEHCDGVDEDCDDAIDEDAVDRPNGFADRDGDGHGDPSTAVHFCDPGFAVVSSADDCDDTDQTAFSGAPDAWYDGVDSNCDGADDFDQDGDGFQSASAEGEDCDDSASTVFPGAPDLDDGRPNDCTLITGHDLDGDGHVDVAFGGDDCDDAHSGRFPGNPEVWYDGTDQDCDGNDTDQDGDGAPVTADCDDLDATVALPEECDPPDTDVPEDTDVEDTDDTDVVDTDDTDSPEDTDVTDTDPPADSGDPTSDPSGCGCESGGAAPWWALGVGVLAARRRRSAALHPHQSLLRR